MEVASIAQVSNIGQSVNSQAVCKAYSSTSNLVKGHGDAIINNTSDFTKFGTFLKSNYATRLNSSDNMVTNAMRIMREDSSAVSILSKQKDNSLALFALALAALDKKDKDDDNTIKALLVAGILGLTNNTQSIFTSSQMQTVSTVVGEVSGGTQASTC